MAAFGLSCLTTRWFPEKGKPGERRGRKATDLRSALSGL